MTGGSVAITGIGVISPVGLGVDALADALDRGISLAPVGKLRLEDYLRSAKTYLDPNSANALAATSLALKDAHLVVGDEIAPSAGITFGTRLGNVVTTETYLKMVREQGVKLASPLLFIHSYPNATVGLLAIEFGLKGTSFNFNSGRWCGLQALIQAFDELRSGKMSVMLAGASDTYTEVTRPCLAGTPFAAAAALVLERAEDGYRRGVRPAVEVAGAGLAATGEEALSRALADAAAGWPQVDWLLADPSAGVAAGRFAARTRATDLVIAVGECGAATALVGLALAAVALREAKLPAKLGLTSPPRTAAVVSADPSGAAAVILRKISD
jgi:3-oxoacyl-(acyl-carrier-protein) synthase